MPSKSAPRRRAPATPRKAAARTAPRRTAKAAAKRAPARPAKPSARSPVKRGATRTAPIRLAPVLVQPRRPAESLRGPQMPQVKAPAARVAIPRAAPPARAPEGAAAWSKPVPKQKPAPKPVPRQAAQPTPKARKASDLPTVDGLTTLVIAKSDVAEGKLRLQVKAPKGLTLPTLHVLRVEHAYELGRSRDDQECRFVLSAKLGGQTPAPDLVRTGEGWAASQDKVGYAQQVFRIPPGKSVLEYEVHAECYTLAKRTGALVATQRRVAKGTIPLRGA